MLPKLISQNGRPAGRTALIGLLISAVTLAVAWYAGSAEPKPVAAPQETWYLYRIAGQDVGRIHETVRRAGDRVTTTVETLVVINRLGSQVKISGKVVFTETAEGQLRSAQSETSSSQQTTTLDAHVEKDKVVLRVSTGGKHYRRELPCSGVLRGPWGIRRQAVRGLQKPGDTLECRTLVPEVESLATVTRKLLETKAPLPTGGAKAAGMRVEERLEGYPGVRAVWLDGTGRMVRQTESGPFGRTEVIVTDRATALRAGSGLLRRELFGQTLVRSNVRLPAPRSLSRVVVRLRHKDGGPGWPDFAQTGQTILRRQGNERLLEVRQVKAEKSTPRPGKADKALREYLEPNAILQSDDAEVRRIAREVAGGETDAFRTALRLRDWVHRRMKMDLGVVLAPASEVIRRRKGTCAAYAIVLASLARAAGIPSRVVMGYAYVSGIWGGHAWVEVWTKDRWVPLDAALPSPGPADAARLAGVRTSLAEGPGPLLGALLRVFGIVQVTVVEYEAGGVRTKVPEGAAAFTIQGDTYRNPWLGLEVHRPAGFRFARTGAVYPDTTVVALDGPAGQRVCVRQLDGPAGRDDRAVGEALRDLGFSGEPRREQLAGRTVLVVQGAAKAGLALTQGPDLWVLTAKGRHAGDLVRRIAARVTIHRPGR
jgi:hypothetical protein